ncbi:SDR family NAD(P)-dependent oxidoreductase [Cognatishimia sp.]|uniref:SDR family NAD(P)-dependent oxidoreductase n=1 Tax=Cognatishimia sp. TaxID=2211648 RepID=UPI003511F9F7|nr:SDR family NAD(P)-dependent oxidoreductase [Cognatishimia sp.]
MERALIIGASGGIGTAIAYELTAKGVDVVALSRRTHGLNFIDASAAETLLAGVEGPFDLVLVVTGALTSTRDRPEKSLAELGAEEMAAQFAVNAIGPALVMKHAKRWLPRKGRSVFAVLSARVGSIGDNRLGGWYSYRASKAALNQVLKTGSIELARTHKEAICVALHPGTVSTRFTENFAAPNKLPPTESASRLIAVIDGLEAHQTGAFFDWKGERIPW